MRRVSRLRHRGGDRSDGRRADICAVTTGTAHPARRDPEHQLPAIGTAGRGELANPIAMLPDEAVPRHQRRVHRANRVGAVRKERPAESALPAVRVGRRRAHLPADRARGSQQADVDRERELHAVSRVRVYVAGVHRAAERAGCRAAVRRVQPLAGAALLPEAVLPRCAEELLRSRGGGRAVSSLDRILPFLRPIEDLLRDPTITEVMVNDGGGHVFVERDGALECVAGRTLESRNLTVAIKNIARACGDEISDMQPVLDARLEDGSRVAAMFPPCAVAGPALTIRKFTRRYSLEDLVTVGAMTSAVASQLTAAIAAQHNILIAGGTGTGKTTLLNALAARIPDDDRIIVIEETAEIHLDKPNILRFEARRAQPPLGQEQPLPPVTIADLVRASLRHRPDRILVGEVRGAEAFDLLQALNTGHLGSLSTIHANSAEQAFTRLAHCVLTANVGLPHRSTREAIGLAIHLVVHIARIGGHRRVTEIAAGRGDDAQSDRFLLESRLLDHTAPEGA